LGPASCVRSISLFIADLFLLPLKGLSLCFVQQFIPPSGRSHLLLHFDRPIFVCIVACPTSAHPQFSFIGVHEPPAIFLPPLFFDQWVCARRFIFYMHTVHTMPFFPFHFRLTCVFAGTALFHPSNIFSPCSFHNTPVFLVIRKALRLGSLGYLYGLPKAFLESPSERH